MTKLNKIKFSLGLVLFSVFLTITASAAGIEVSPSKINLTTTKDQAVETNLVVANPTADVQIFQVYSDDFTNLISANPASFTLESGARKNVTIKIKPSGSEKTIATNISVVGQPLAQQQISVGTGVKIPISIQFIGSVKTAENQYRWMIIAGAIVLIAGLATYLIKKPKLAKS